MPRARHRTGFPCCHALGCLKGISTQTAMVLVTEIGDFRRFEHPGKLMAHVGLKLLRDSPTQDAMCIEGALRAWALVQELDRERC